MSPSNIAPSTMFVVCLRSHASFAHLDPNKVVKTQLQSSQFVGQSKSAMTVTRTIFRTEGYRGFFRGVKPLLVGIIPTRAIYFYSYALSKNSLNQTLGNSPLNHLASAFFAGVTSNTIMNPLWMVSFFFLLDVDYS